MAMTFEDFVKYSADNIKSYLPAEYGSGVVSVYEVTKLGSSYTGMSLKEQDRNSAVTINLNKHYDEYQKNEKIGQVMREMAQIIMTRSIGDDYEWLTDYEQVKERLFVRVSNADTNEAVIGKVPHIIKEDLVLTSHVLIGKDNSVISTIVTDNLLKSYGVTKEQLFADAIDNSQKLFPIRVQSLEALMFEIAGAEGYEPPSNGKDRVLVVTNNQGINGAAALFYPDAMEKLAAMIDDDYYIIPSSIHEILVIPDSDHIGYEVLESTLHNVNETIVEPQDQLSDRVYHYDSAENIFELAEDYALRTHQSDRAFSTLFAM